MKKHTKEYAEKLAFNHIGECIYSESDRLKYLSYQYGYMKAIEETNHVEVLEALKKLRGIADLFGNDSSGRVILRVQKEDWSNLLNAIKKAES